VPADDCKLLSSPTVALKPLSPAQISLGGGSEVGSEAGDLVAEPEQIANEPITQQIEEPKSSAEVSKPKGKPKPKPKPKKAAKKHADKTKHKSTLTQPGKEKAAKSVEGLGQKQATQQSKPKTSAVDSTRKRRTTEPFADPDFLAPDQAGTARKRPADYSKEAIVQQAASGSESEIAGRSSSESKIDGRSSGNKPRSTPKPGHSKVGRGAGIYSSSSSEDERKEESGGGRSHSLVWRRGSGWLYFNFLRLNLCVDCDFGRKQWLRICLYCECLQKRLIGLNTEGLSEYFGLGIGLGLSG